MENRVVYLTFEDRKRQAIITRHGVLGFNDTEAQLVRELLLVYAKQTYGYDEKQLQRAIAEGEFVIHDLGEVQAPNCVIYGFRHKEGEFALAFSSAYRNLRQMEIERVIETIYDVFHTPIRYDEDDDYQLRENFPQYEGKTVREITEMLNLPMPRYIRFWTGEGNDLLDRGETGISQVSYYDSNRKKIVDFSYKIGEIFPHYELCNQGITLDEHLVYQIYESVGFPTFLYFSFSGMEFEIPDSE